MKLPTETYLLYKEEYVPGFSLLDNDFSYHTRFCVPANATT